MTTARDAFESRLATFLAAHPADWSTVAVRPANDGFDPPDDLAPFIVLQFPASSEEPVSLGAPGTNVHRERGGARFVLMIPVGQGETDWRPRVEALRAHFRSTAFGGVVTYGASPPAIGDASDHGSYWAMAWVVSYRFDLHG